MKYTFDDTTNPDTGKENHVHLLDMEDGRGFRELTGTSGIGNVLAKEGLTWWASRKACEDFGFIHPDIKKNGKKVGKVPTEDRLLAATKVWEQIVKENPFQYLDRLDKAYKAHKTSLDNSAKKGTDLHAELEKYVKSKMGIWQGATLFDPRIEPFMVWTMNNVKQFLWSEAYCFDETLWVGGISDAGAELNDGRIAIIDFKSSVEAYETNYIQAGGYAIQIEKNGLWDKFGKMNKRIDKPFTTFIIVPFGAEVVEPDIRDDVEKYKEAFRLAVPLYRILGLGKKHD